MRPRAILFSQGDEVLTGQTVDTNAAWLARRLDGLGLDVVRHVTVGDRLPDLIETLKAISEQAEMCICSGGLGPTQDDLTAEAVASAFQYALIEDADALKSIERFFAKRGVAMPSVNRKQALLPEGSVRLDNDWGTAPGFSLQANGCQFFFVPGVPFEMKQIYQHSIEPMLKDNFDLEPPKRVILRILGMGESRIQELLNDVSLPPDVAVSFRAGLPENELKLLFPATYSNDSLKACVQQVRQALGEAVYAVDGLDASVESLYQWVDQLMRQSRQRLAVVETVSQGVLASQCQSEWLLSGQVFPKSVDALSHFDLNASETGINKQLAKQLAGRLKVLTGAPMALCQLEKMSDEPNAPSTIITAVAHSKGVKVSTHSAHGRAERRRIMAAAQGFDVLRKVLISGGV